MQILRIASARERAAFFANGSRVSRLRAVAANSARIRRAAKFAPGRKRDIYADRLPIGDVAAQWHG
jgi:hypothetical protein